MHPISEAIVATLAMGLVVGGSAGASARDAPPADAGESASPGVAAYDWQEVAFRWFGLALDVAVTVEGDAVALTGDCAIEWNDCYSYSQDWHDWQSARLPSHGLAGDGGERFALPLEIVVTPDGLYAIGGDHTEVVRKDPRDTVVWRSRDGATWDVTATIPDFTTRTMAAGPDGLVLAGTRIPATGKWIRAVYRSRDGSDWRIDPLETGGPRPDGVAVADDGTVLVRGHNYAHGERSRTRIWRSTGGGEWESVDLPGGLAYDTPAIMLGPVATPQGFLVATREADRPADRLWRSTDGRDWLEVAMPAEWNAERSWHIVQPWPYANLAVSARTSLDDVSLASLLLTPDGGETWCVSDGPRTPGVRMLDAAAAPDGSVFTTGDLRFSGRAWSVRPITSEPATTAAGDAAVDGNPFPCQPVRAIELPGMARQHD